MAKYIIDQTGDWKKFVSEIPAGYRAVGTVFCELGAGALFQNMETHRYCHMVGDTETWLDGRSISGALGTNGKKKELDDGKRVNVYLDGDSLAAAAIIGGGNVSDGIRKALKEVILKMNNQSA